MTQKVDIRVCLDSFSNTQKFETDNGVGDTHLTAAPSNAFPHNSKDIILFDIRLNNRCKTLAKNIFTLYIKEFQQESDKVHGMETVPDSQEE